MPSASPSAGFAPPPRPEASARAAPPSARAGDTPFEDLLAAADALPSPALETTGPSSDSDEPAGNAAPESVDPAPGNAVASTTPPAVPDQELAPVSYLVVLPLAAPDAAPAVRDKSGAGVEALSFSAAPTPALPGGPSAPASHGVPVTNAEAADASANPVGLRDTGEALIEAGGGTQQPMGRKPEAETALRSVTQSPAGAEAGGAIKLAQAPAVGRADRKTPESGSGAAALPVRENSSEEIVAKNAAEPASSDAATPQAQHSQAARRNESLLRLVDNHPLPTPSNDTAVPVPTIAASAHTASPWIGHAVTAAAPTHDAAVPLTGIAVEIAARALEGKHRFEIRLDPPELGRIDVRLDVGRDEQVTARLVVERAETLDLLRRDAPALERALQSAGLRTNDSALEFSLRDQTGGGYRPRGDEAPRSNLLIVPDEDVAVREAVRRAYGVLRGLGGGVDIRV